jgi:hypothetical protein
MRTSTAYFAGVGTVAVAIAAGLGGGLLFANIVAPHEPKYAAEPTKLEQRMAVRSIAVTRRRRRNRFRISPLRNRQRQTQRSWPRRSRRQNRLKRRRPNIKRRAMPPRRSRSRHHRKLRRRPSPPRVSRPLRRARRSPKHATPISSAWPPRSGAPSAISDGPTSAAIASLASRNWRRSSRASGRQPSRGRLS